MKLEPVLLDKIEAYLAGRLSPDESTGLEQRAAADPELAMTIEFVRLERDGMELIVEQNLRADMAAFEQERAAATQTPMKARVNGFRFRTLILAAAAVFFAAATGILMWNTNPELFGTLMLQKGPASSHNDREEGGASGDPASPGTDSQNVDIAREAYDIQVYPSISNAYKTPLELADSLYTAKEYLEAAKVLGRNLAYEQAYFKRGHAYFMAGMYAEAAADFETVVEDNGDNLAEAKWYWSLSLLAHREAKDSKLQELLNETASDEKSAWRDKAREILAKIQPR